MKKGFTLTEVLITVVILAVLASIAIPSFSKTKDKAALHQAIAYLRVIRTGQKMYYAKWATYATGLDTAGIRSELGAEVAANQGYTLSVPAVAGGATFTAQATKAGADTITIDQDGNFTKGGAAYIPSN